MSYVKKVVDEYRPKVIEEEIRFLSTHRYGEPAIWDRVVKGSSRGKKLRPILAIETYKALTGEDDILPISISVELLHRASLFQDDVIDGDDFRRGEPAFHRMISSHFEDERNAESAAICYGNLLANLGKVPILESDMEDRKKVRIIELFTETENKLNEGEIMDIYLSDRFSQVYEDEYMKMIELKTSSLIEASIGLGTILGEALKDEEKAFMEFARNCGRAYQIRDDILGSFGDEKITGKPSDSDIRKGKKSILTIKAGEFGRRESKILDDLLGKENMTEEDVETVRNIYMDTGALDYAEKLVWEFSQKAKRWIRNLDICEKKFFMELVDYLAGRIM